MGSEPAVPIAPAAIKCPRCREPIAPDASICRVCRASALVDVRVTSAVGDSRLRYQAARALMAVRPSLKLVDVQQALGLSDGTVMSGVTPGEGAAAIEVLARMGIRSGVAAVEVATPWLTPARMVLFVLGLVAVIAVVVGIRMFDAAARPRTAAVTTPAPAAAGPAPAAALTTTDIAYRSLPSVVSLRCAQSLGTGFFVAPDLLMTNAHVLCDNESSIKVVFKDGREFVGQVAQADTSLDLAVVRVEGTGAAPLPLGDVGTLDIGARLVMIGCPMGLDFTVNEAAVTSLSRALLGVAYVQIEAKVNPGNSGGPILDRQGRVVGIVTLKETKAEGIGFAMPINYAWTGASPVLSGIAAAESPRFTEMRAQADAQADEVSRQVSGTPLLPVPAGVYVDAYKRLVLQILLPARSMPRPQEVTVYVRRGSSEILCTMKASVPEWKPVERTRAFEPRVQSWFDRIGIGHLYLYEGEAPLRPEQCPDNAIGRGMEFELEGGDPAASRMLFR